MLMFASLVLSLLVSGPKSSADNGKKIQFFSASRYVDSSESQLRVACPSNFQIVSAYCDTESQFPSANDTSGENAMRMHFTKNPVIEESLLAATCQAAVTRPDEILKVSMTLKCIQKETPL